MPRSLSAVVPVWNCQKTIRRCLSSLRGLEPREIIVCDLGSTDHTSAIVASDFADAALLQLGPIKSFAIARNAGLALATGTFILFADGDWIADGASVDRLIRELDAHTDTAIAVPRFLDDLGNDHVGHNIRRFPTAEALAAEFLMLHKVFGSKAVTRYRMLDFDHLSSRNIDHACGAFILARREALLICGGYDETLEGAWMEDVDLGQRLRQRDWGSRFCASASAVHIGRETIRHFFIERHYDAYYRSVLRYAGKYLPKDYDFIRVCLLAGLVSKATFSYALPASLRTRLLRHLDLYNSDDAIQGYRQMYLRAIEVVRAMSGPC